MRTIGIVGLSDPRHLLYLDPLRRRRAGIRVAGLSEPDEDRRRGGADRPDVATFGDHRSLMAQTTPDLLAVSGGDVDAVVDGLAAGLDVVATAPLAHDLDGVRRLRAAVAGARGELRALHPWRGRPGTALALELLDGGTVGEIQGAVLGIEAGLSTVERRRALADGTDLFLWLTGGEPAAVDAVTPSDDDGSALVVTARTSAGDVELEVVDLDGAPAGEAFLQLAGERGTIEWSLRTGMLLSAPEGRPPVKIDAGRPRDEAAWVLSEVIRSAHPQAPAGEAALWSTELALLSTP